MKAKQVALVVVFSALMFAVAGVNRIFRTAAHITSDAILCTCLLITMMEASGKPGVATLVGFTTGLLFTALGSPFVSIASWFVRGLVLDVAIFTVFKGRSRGMVEYGVAAPTAFFLHSLTGKSLYLLVLAGRSWLLIFKGLWLPMIIAGSALSLAGVYLALKVVIPRVVGVAGVRI